MRFLVILLMLNFQAQAQVRDFQQRHSEYMERAQFRHDGNVATVSVNDPRPLAQTVRALSDEYGWTVDYEDPPYYSQSDLVDDTAPNWRAAHPNAKGVTVIGGGAFQTQITGNPSSAAEEAHVLDGVVSDYNKSGNPGRFSVLDEGDGRFAVIGTHIKSDKGEEQTVSSILDTAVSVPVETRSASETLSAILTAVSAKNQTAIGPGSMPINLMLQSTVTVGGQNVPARTLLMQTLSGLRWKLSWHLYYDADTKSYALNLLHVKTATAAQATN
jgi:hypothetical protein